MGITTRPPHMVDNKMVDGIIELKLNQSEYEFFEPFILKLHEMLGKLKRKEINLQEFKEFGLQELEMTCSLIHNWQLKQPESEQEKQPQRGQQHL